MNLIKKRTLKRKIVIISAAAVIAAASASYGTVAYFTSEDTARNVITAGNVKIELRENALSDDGTLVPFEDRIDVMPGCEVSKIVQVENTGSQSAWIRVSVKKDIILAEGAAGETDLSLVSFNPDTEHWTEKNGFFYYNTSLEPGQTTEPLFTSVAFAADMGNLYQDSKAELTVSAFAVQTANNGNDAFEAAGWSESK